MSCPEIPDNCPRVAARAGYSQWSNEPIWACGHTVVWLLRKVVTDDKGEIGPGALRSAWIAVAANDCRCAWLDKARAMHIKYRRDNQYDAACDEMEGGEQWLTEAREAEAHAEAWRKWGTQ